MILNIFNYDYKRMSYDYKRMSYLKFYDVKFCYLCFLALELVFEHLAEWESCMRPEDGSSSGCSTSNAGLGTWG